MVLTRNGEAARRALLSLALGSEALASQVDAATFASQEKQVPPVMGFIYEIYATHPCMTRRIIELSNYEKRFTLGTLLTSMIEPLREAAAGNELKS